MFRLWRLGAGMGQRQCIADSLLERAPVSRSVITHESMNEMQVHATEKVASEFWLMQLGSRAEVNFALPSGLVCCLFKSLTGP